MTDQSNLQYNWECTCASASPWPFRVYRANHHCCCFLILDLQMIRLGSPHHYDWLSVVWRTRTLDWHSAPPHITTVTVTGHNDCRNTNWMALFEPSVVSWDKLNLSIWAATGASAFLACGDTDIEPVYKKKKKWSRWGSGPKSAHISSCVHNDNACAIKTPEYSLHLGFPGNERTS
jgi:hypothetical protein